VRLGQEIQALPRPAQLTVAHPSPTRGEAAPDVVEVAVGVLRDSRGRFLINRRPDGKPMAGWWEFPGGKRAVGESAWEALCRELAEELGVMALEGEPLVAYVYDYPDRRVRLDVFTVSRFTGDPRGREGQTLRWATLAELETVGLLRGNGRIIEALRLGAAAG
jgi:8-oxo-dGTP diphosphatase